MAQAVLIQVRPAAHGVGVERQLARLQRRARTASRAQCARRRAGGAGRGAARGVGLMVRTFLSIREVPPGFVRPAEVLTFRVSIPQAVVEDDAQTARLTKRSPGRCGRGGVEPSACPRRSPWTPTAATIRSGPKDFPAAGGHAADPPLQARRRGYFETMGNPIIAGRAITWSDVHNAAPVVMLSENLAREYWGEPAKAIGRRVRSTPTDPWFEIIGVAGNERQDGRPSRCRRLSTGLCTPQGRGARRRS